MYIGENTVVNHEKVAPARKAGDYTKTVRYQVDAYLFVLPALLILATFVIYPILRLFYLSFTDYQLLVPESHFIGFENYIKALHDPLFLKTMKNSLYFTVVDCTLQGSLALIIAIMTNYALRGFKVFRTIVYIPAVTSFVSVCILWKLMYHGDYGLISSIFSDILGLGVKNYLADPKTAMNAIIIACSWKGIGWYMTMFLAGLSQIPEELYESSQIDGATFWKKFVYITIPLLKNTILFVLVMEIIDAMKVYIPSFVMTSGGPLDSTNLPVYNIWIQAFKLMDVGYASAMAVLFFLVVMVITALQFKVMKENI